MDRRILVVCLIVIAAGLAGLFGGVALQPEFAADRRVILLPFFSVCTALITSSILIIIFDLYVRREDRARKDADTVKEISSTVQETLILGSVGIRGLHDGIQDHRLIEEAQDSQMLRVLNTYAPNVQTLRPAIERILENEGTVQFALASVKSPFVDMRLKGLHRARSEFEGSVATNISRLIQMWDASGRKGNLEIRSYGGSPGICYYATGKICFVGSYLEGRDAINSPQIELDKRSWAYERYKNHFEDVWRDAEPIMIPENQDHRKAAE